MNINITVNNNKISATKGETILNVLKKHGITIPTLCYMEDLSPTGACRLCVVELKNENKLVTSCSTPIKEGMEILTHSGKVIKARKTIVELLLTNHPDNCLYCDKSGICELQKLTESLNISERVYHGKKNSGKTDRSSPGIVRDMSRCILCGRCVRTCDEIIGISAIDTINRGKNTSIDTVLSKGLFYSSCIHCGQCITACPTGAILEKNNLLQITDKLTNNAKIDIIISPSTIADIAVYTNLKKYEDCRDYLIASLKHIGFNKVYTLSWANDIFIYEAAKYIHEKLNKPLDSTIISNCPSIKYFIKSEFPELEKHLFPVNYPQQIFGKFLKQDKIDNGILLCSVTPCVSHKYEAVQSKNTNKGVPDIDFVLTSNELIRLLNTHGIEFPFSKKTSPDHPAINDSSGAVLFEIRGGISEAIYREIAHKEKIENTVNKIQELRSGKDITEVEIPVGKYNLKILVIEGIKNIKPNINRIKFGKYHIIELRSCNSGCIEGCGQRSIYMHKKNDTKKISKLLYDYDEKNPINTPGKNPFIKGFYRETDSIEKYLK